MLTRGVEWRRGRERCLAVRSSLLLLAALAVLAGCGDTAVCQPGPWRTEVWHPAPRVEAELRAGCGFPDTPTDYRVRAHGRVVLEGSLEHFDRRRDLRVVDDAGRGAVEVTIWDRACVVAVDRVDCRDVDYRRW
jgi:hypothetical protein